LGGVAVFKKFFENELGKISNNQMKFAKDELKNEHKAKGTPKFGRGERADKLATYIDFGRRNGI
jgi:hypothetical protein